MDMFDFRAREESRVDPETEALAHESIGAAIEVHREVGPGLPENVYKLAMSHELKLRGIPHQVEVPVAIFYKGVPVGEGRADIVVGGRLVLELKAVDALSPVHKAQLLGYLRVLKLQLGLLINFNVIVLKDGLKRVINTI